MTRTEPRSARLLGGFAAPLRVRRLRLLLLGQVASRSGDLVYTVAIASYALTLDPRGRLLAVVLLAQVIGTLLMLVLSGAITDRLGARRVLLTADAIRSVALAALSVHVLTGSETQWVLIAVGAAIGVGDGLFEPSFVVALADATTDESRIGANSLKSLTWRLSAILGAALGGILVSSAGTGVAFAVSAFAFVGAGTAVLRMGRGADDRPRAHQSAASVLADVKQGWIYLRSVPWLLALIATSGLVTSLVMAPSRALLPLVLTDSFGTTGLYSSLLIAEAAGGLISAVVIGRYGALPYRGVVAAAGMLTYCAGYVVAAQSLSIVLSVVALACGAAAVTASTVAYMSILQTSVPEGYLGRVSAFDSVLTIGGAPLVLAAIPLLAPLIGASLILTGAAGIAALACISCLALRRCRAL